MTKREELYELAIDVEDSLSELLDFIEQISDTDILRQALPQINRVKLNINDIILFSNDLKEEDYE